MKRGQTALEYLITYGWAILIILVVLAVLWYYDVFNPSKWAGEQEYCPSAFELLGTSLTGAGQDTGTLTLVVGNKVGNQVTITNMTVDGDVNGTWAGTQVLAPGGQSSGIAVIVGNLTSYTVGDIVTMTVDIDFTDNSLNLADSEICEIRKKAS